MSVRYTSLALAALAVGCVGEAPPADLSSTTLALLTPTAFDWATACTDDLQVGVQLSTLPSCPAAGAGWAVDRPTSATLPTGSRFCRYRWIAGGPADTATLPSDSGRPPATWLDPDCPAVVPLGGGDPLAFVHGRRHAAYREQMEQARGLPYLRATSGRTVGPSPVRIALIDSSEDSAPGDLEPTSGDFPHGRAVGLAIREMTCPQGRHNRHSACIPRFHSYLALDLEHGDAAPGGSGYHGHLSTLAQRIDDAVDDWQASGSGEPLIINLSLGWHPEYNTRGRYRGTTVRHSAAMAVRAALDRATCAGALVIAAVGNHTGGPDGTSGPMYPAAWASESTWCGAHPLLVAVGGVDNRDFDLANARPSARTELIAPAFHVAVDNSLANADPSPPLLPLMSGSSFGAAGVTAAAALVWGYYPTLSPVGVMNAVYTSARALATAADPRTADVCHGAPCQSARRVSMCRAAELAISLACSPGQVVCPAPLECEAVAPYAGANPSSAVIPPGATLLPTPTWSRLPAPDCAAGQAWADASGLPASPNLCPSETDYGVLVAPHTVSSQPGPLGCDVCAVILQDNSRMLYLTIDPDWDPFVPLKSPVLRVDEQLFALESVIDSPLGPGDQLVVELPEFPEPKEASLAFGVDADLAGENGDYSLFEQIEIWYQ